MIMIKIGKIWMNHMLLKYKEQMNLKALKLVIKNLKILK